MRGRETKGQREIATTGEQQGRGIVQLYCFGSRGGGGVPEGDGQRPQTVLFLIRLSFLGVASGT
jgi:hypothetical protein